LIGKADGLDGELRHVFPLAARSRTKIIRGQAALAPISIMSLLENRGQRSGPPLLSQDEAILGLVTY
jgi:hypothetical protein